MSDKKPTQSAMHDTSAEGATSKDPERTLLTLDQLSQTIEVMSSVVNRLRAHLGEQIVAAAQAGNDQPYAASNAEPTKLVKERPSFIVDIVEDSGKGRQKGQKKDRQNEDHDIAKVLH